MCSKVQLWLAQCEIAQDRSGLNDGIVVLSGILEDIWDNRFLVHLPSVFKVKPIDRGGETPFGQTPFSLEILTGILKRSGKGFWVERWTTESQMLMQTRISK